jgi:heme-degrading monooxygenase HmoA
VDVARWDSAEQAIAALDERRRPGWAEALRVHDTTALYETMYEFRPSVDRRLDGPGVTFMNIFEIDPATVDGFAAGWSDRARLMSSAPGFRDVRLHRAVSSAARFQLVNIAHWDSVAVWRAATQNSAMTAATGVARAHATPNTAIYEVAGELGGVFGTVR